VDVAHFRYFCFGLESRHCCKKSGRGKERARESTPMSHASSLPSFPPRFSPLQDLFNKYTQYSKSIMSTLPPKEVPVDLTDSHLFVKACDVVGSQEEFDENVLRDIAISVANGYESCTDMVKVSCGALVSS